MTSTPLITFAMREESRGVRWDRMPFPSEVLFTGVGGVRAGRNLAAALARARPPFVISTGFAGGIAPRGAPGDLVISAELSSGFLVEAARIAASRANLPVTSGVILTLHSPLMSSREKEMLYTQTGATAVDMETSILHEICLEKKIPFLAIRAICDSANIDIPLPLEICVGPKGDEPRIARILGFVARRPWVLPGVFRLMNAALAARRSIGRLLPEVLREIESNPSQIR